MQFFSYQINPKHRAIKPTSKASIWCASEWIEVQLFAKAYENKWCSINKNLLWSIHAFSSQLSKIGIDVSNDLYIAKYVCDMNHCWHGYPVHPRGNDIPPESVLELWRIEKLIDNTDKRRIQSGRFNK